MYTTVTKYDFHDAFRDWHGGTYRNNFSYEGRELLFDWLDEIEQVADEIELDVVALCCDYSEEAPEEICRNYGLDPDVVIARYPYALEVTLVEAVAEWLDTHGYGHCGITEQGTIVYQVF